MTWIDDWTQAGRTAEQRAAEESCARCGGTQTVGFSNLGIPLVACPTCSPSLVANRKRTVDEAWGVSE